MSVIFCCSSVGCVSVVGFSSVGCSSVDCSSVVSCSSVGCSSVVGSSVDCVSVTLCCSSVDCVSVTFGCSSVVGTSVGCCRSSSLVTFSTLFVLGVSDSKPDNSFGGIFTDWSTISSPDLISPDLSVTFLFG
jgi:hypothetical protein